jgi:hypothetical protein
MNLLGYGLPQRLIGALEGNVTGHWEPENIVLYNDRLLADMGSAWHDFTALPFSQLSPGEMRVAQIQIAELLDREYGGEQHIILKDPRVCRFAFFYIGALKELGYRVVPIIAFRNPGEVIRSLQRRRSNWPEGFSGSQAALMWLRHVLDAEFNTRGMKRAFSEYSAFLNNWQSEVLRMARQGGFEFPDPVEQISPIIEEFLRPDLKHESEQNTEISGRPMLRGWCHRTQDALRKLVVAPDSAVAMTMLDRVRAEFDAAELILSDLSDSSVTAIGDLSRRLRASEQDNDQKHKFLRAKEEETTGLLQRIEGQDAQIAELNVLNGIAQDDLKAARQRIEGQDAQIAELSGLLAKARQDIDSRAADIVVAMQRLEDSAARVAALNHLLHDRNQHIDRLHLQIKNLKQAYLSSLSWRVTAPLRKAGSVLRGFRKAGRKLLRLGAAKGGIIAGTAPPPTRIPAQAGPKGMKTKVNRKLGTTRAPRVLPGSIDPASCFIATSRQVANIAAMMADVLQEEGYHVQISTDLNGADLAAHVFVICPQIFDSLPDDYIAFQMEQSVSSRWFTADYFERLGRARAIIDYSTENLRFLRQNNLPLHKLHYVPLDVDPKLLSAPEADRKGILFYGDDKCPRRQRILQAVRSAYPELKIVNNLYGEDIERELRHTAVVLNVHYYENALLETARIFQALSYGIPVVSEESSDQKEHTDLIGIVDFAPVDDIPRIIELLRPYVEGSSVAIEKRARIATFTQRPDNRFRMFFRRFLLSQRMIGYDAFQLRAPLYPMDLNGSGSAQFCLSLPETPERRDLFLQQNRNDFRLWNGLKATPGWMGAALSYRHMFERLVASDVDRAIVCEDDVLFPVDFNERLAIIQRYLDQHDWDIFSGFVADVHADMTITDVEEFEGQTFVHVDRTVSMVFNIYNRSIMEFLSKWDSSNTDVHGNTIDRYLEGRSRTRAILTLPFLVGHRSDADSTLWGFQNSNYEKLIEKSETLLADKIRDFRNLKSRQS